jgi:phytoene desaturase
VRPWSTVDGDLRRFFEDPRVRLAFTFQRKYLGMSPLRCPSLFTILSFMEYEYGVFHPIGGCAAVSEAMARTAVDLGAELRLDEPVVGLKFDGRRVIGVRTELGEYPCDATVVNADFAHTMRRLVPDRLRRRWSDRRIGRKKFSCSTFMMYLGLEGRTDLPHHSISLTEDFRRNFEDIETGVRLPDDPSLYVCNPTATDPSMAPDGHSSLYVLVPVPHLGTGIDWPREQAGFRAKVLRKLESLGVRDVARRTRFEKILTPRDWESDLRIHLGSTFNLAHSLGQLLHLRPQNRFEELDGVYLVGGATHPGSGLPVIYESAKITSRLLAEDLGVRASWSDAGREAPIAALLADVG